MKAMVLEAFGGVENFHLRELPLPEPGTGEVRLRIQAFSVNPVDIKMREGRIPGPVPVVLGRDIAGVVDEVGEGVSGLKRGDPVVAVLSGPRSNGAYAEYVTTPAAFVTPKPKGISNEQGAALGVAGLTAYEAVVRKGHIQAGEAALVAGGAGGVGSMVIQLLQHYGSSPILVTSGSAESAEYLTSALGVSPDQLVQYPGRSLDQLEAQVREMSGGKGVAAAFDLVGDEMKKLCLRSLDYDGRVMSIVEEESMDFKFDIWRPAVSPLWPKSGSFHYVAMSARARSENPDDWRVYPEMWKALTRLLEEGRIKPPPITSMGVMSEANLRKAHTLLGTGHVKGKLVLQVD